MLVRRVVGLGAIIALSVSSLTVAPALAAEESEAAFIVELAPSASVDEVIDEVLDGGEPTETYSDVVNGFAADLTPSEVAELESSPEVVAVYEDFVVSVGATQPDAPWNLSRLDDATAPADAFYTYPDSAGSGTRIYIVDTGIAPNAAQFGSRLLPGVTMISDGRGTTDCNGHGTHVAGTAASATYGVAKQASVIPVRVFSCTGSTSTSTVVAGLDWIVANHPAGTPGIVNMSLGSEETVPLIEDFLSQKVNTMATLGFVMVVAAGNSNADACAYSPSRAANALTVGATQTNDARASFSNFGTCLDLFAPGTSIRSLQWNNPAGSMLMQGTSMAAPLVAGVAALMWGASPSSTASAITAQVVSQAIPNVVTNQGTGSTSSLSSIATLNGGVIEYSTTPGGVAMLRLYFSSGAAAGPLGAPNSALSGLTCNQNATSCRIDFANGIISWGTTTGAFSILNPIAPYWNSRGGATGALGNPTNAASTFTTTSNGNGQVQIFQGGHVYSSAAGVFTVKSGTPVGNAWAAAGWIRGSLGWPIADETCSAGVCTQQFQGGTIRGNTVIPSVTDAAILAYWNSRGGATGALGNPTNAVATFTTTSNGNGQVQIFQGGHVYSSAAGVFTVKSGTPVGNAWAAAGWIRGSLGWPIADETCSAGVCTQQFQGGTIRGNTVIPSVTDAAILAYWNSRGGSTGALGNPTNAVATFTTTSNGNGQVQIFQGGYVYSSTRGVFTVKHGVPVGNTWAAAGWIRGFLGWPVAEESCSAGVCSQQFQGGTVRGTTIIPAV